MIESISISPATRTILLELAEQTGRSPSEVLSTAVEALRHQFTNSPPSEIDGVNIADVWEANAQADSGELRPHHEVFSRLRSPQ
jgi:predicted transcriptional regulator